MHTFVLMFALRRRGFEIEVLLGLTVGFYVWLGKVALYVVLCCGFGV